MESLNPKVRNMSDKPKDAPQRRNKFEQLIYLGNLAAVVRYLDATGMEHHEQRVVLAAEWDQAFTEFCETIGAEDD